MTEDTFIILDLSGHKILEYRWPQDELDGEMFVLQEQIADYLGIRTFQRRFPDLERRNVSPEEKEFLLSTDTVNETYSTLGLVALKTTTVLELMQEEFPRKHYEFTLAIEEKTILRIMRNQQTHYDNISSRKCQNQSDVGLLARKAILSATDYNSFLNQERTELRSKYFDQNTQIVHIPTHKRKYPVPHIPQGTQYPVALLPGQYQDTYHTYPSKMLRHLPFDTILEPHPTIIKRLKTSVKDDLTNLQFPDGNFKSNNSQIINPITPSQFGKASPIRKAAFKKRPSSAICLLCLKQKKGINGIVEEFVHCSQCTTTVHPSCLNLSDSSVERIHSYKWQCLECKTCMICNSAGDEDQMVLCFACDRGYHTFCMKFPCVPCGVWVCDLCTTCNICGTSEPDFDTDYTTTSRLFQWRHLFSHCTVNINNKTTPIDNTTNTTTTTTTTTTNNNNNNNSSGSSSIEFLQTMCRKCSALFDKGNFCPVCLRIYNEDDSDILMVCCDKCERWIHKDCEDMDDVTYEHLSKEIGTYHCTLCRGDKPDRYDRFHKKNVNRVILETEQQ